MTARNTLMQEIDAKSYDKETADYMKDQVNRHLQNQHYYPMISDNVKQEISQSREAYRDTLKSGKKVFKTFHQHGDRIDTLNASYKQEAITMFNRIGSNKSNHPVTKQMIE